jgi:cell division protein FtsQ
MKAAKRKKKIIYVILGLILAFALALLILWNLKVETVHVKGADYYTEEEIENFIFQKPIERNVLYAWLMNRFGEDKTIPFVSGYTMTFDGFQEVTITVYEKSVIGYIDFMGSHMYFDKDGTVVESSSEVYEGVPQIAGLSFDYMVLYKTLPVKDSSVFTQILNLTQMVAKYHLDVDKIYFDSSMNATLYLGKIRVVLGDKTSMEDKIAELSGMIPEMEGLSGTLHLENYDKTAINPYYSFLPDAEEEEETQEFSQEETEE